MISENIINMNCKQFINYLKEQPACVVEDLLNKVRLPKQMENVSTKTILQSIDWDKMALDMLDKCSETINDAILEIDEDIDYSVSFAVLTNSSEYPNTTI